MRLILLLLLVLQFGFAKKIALVIGNSNYSQGYLANPINDAKLIRDTLQDNLNFKVTYKHDLTRYEMREAIRDFASSIQEEDIALFYYSGHGMQYNSLNYLIPLKANAVTEGQIPSEGVDVSYILGGMEKAKLAILLLDACRNNPFRSFSRSTNKGLAQIRSSQRNYIVSYATEAGAVAKDGDGTNSPYALVLSRLLKQQMSVTSLFQELRNQVAKKTNYAQYPYCEPHFIGSFTLGSGNGGGGSCSKVVRVPPIYKSVREKVKVSDKRYPIKITPTQFKTIIEKVLIKPKHRKYIYTEDGITKTIEDKLILKTKKLLVGTSYTRLSVDENDESRIKEEIIPAIYKRFKSYRLDNDFDITKVLKNKAYKSILIPATYKAMTKRVVVKPAHFEKMVVPATYKTVTRQVLVSEATEKRVSVPCSEI